MRYAHLLVLSLLCCAPGCGRTTSTDPGGGGGGGGNPIPVDHTLVAQQAATFAAGGFYGFEFALPSRATVSLSASETTTDTWNVAVFTPAEWVSYQSGSGNQAVGCVNNNVRSASDSCTLPAGDYFLGFRCTNLIQRCMLVYSLHALY